MQLQTAQMGRARRLAGGTGLGGSLGAWAAGLGFGDLPPCCGRAPAWGTSCGLADFDYVRTWADGSRGTLRRHSPSAPKPRQCSAVFAGAWPGRAQPAPPMGALECHIASIALVKWRRQPLHYGSPTLFAGMAECAERNRGVRVWASTAGHAPSLALWARGNSRMSGL